MRHPAGYRERLELMDAARLSRTLARMAHEMAERHPDISRAVLVGVRTRGVPLAQRLARLIGAAAGEAPVGGRPGHHALSRRPDHDRGRTPC